MELDDNGQLRRHMERRYKVCRYAAWWHNAEHDRGLYGKKIRRSMGAKNA